MHAFHGWKVIFQIKSQSVRFHFKTRPPEPKSDNAVSISVFAMIDKNDWGRNGGVTPVYTE